MSRELMLEGHYPVPPGCKPMGGGVRLGTTAGTSAGYVYVTPELDDWTTVYYSPARARELAFALMDFADLAEIDTGQPPTLDPFELHEIETLLAVQAGNHQEQ